MTIEKFISLTIAQISITLRKIYFWYLLSVREISNCNYSVYFFNILDVSSYRYRYRVIPHPINRIYFIQAD